MRKIRTTVSLEAVLRLSGIWPHGNPVQGSNSVWLLRIGAQVQECLSKAIWEVTRRFAACGGAHEAW